MFLVLDDFPATEFIRGIRVGMCPIDQLYNRWTSIFNYTVANNPGSVFALTNHPQTIGRAHTIQLLEQMIQHIVLNNGWVTTLDIIASTYKENR